MKKLLILFMFSICVLGYSETLRIHIGTELRQINLDFENLIIKAVKNAGHTPVIVPDAPAQRAQKQLANGEFDIYFRVSAHSKEQNIAIPIQVPLIFLKIRAFANNDIGATTLKDLQGKTFASVQGLTLNDIVMKMIPNVEMYDKLENFQKVLQFIDRGRADFFIQQLEAGNAFIKQAGLEDKITMIDETLVDIPIWMYIHNSKSSHIDSIKPVLEEMVKNGEF